MRDYFLVFNEIGLIFWIRSADWIQKLQNCVEVVDLVKSFPASVAFAKFGFDTAENEPL